MPHSFGYRARTRDMFSRLFRHHGMPKPSTYLQTYKIGDYVDIKANGAIHSGMPHKFYHGRTGIVWNVTPRAVGVEVNKIVRNRVIKKKIHVRVEHVTRSKCRDAHIARVKKNDLLKKKAAQFKKEGKKAPKLKGLKRRTRGPRRGVIVKISRNNLETVKPQLYELVV